MQGTLTKSPSTTLCRREVARYRTAVISWCSGVVRQSLAFKLFPLVLVHAPVVCCPLGCASKTVCEALLWTKLENWSVLKKINLYYKAGGAGWGTVYICSGFCFRPVPHASSQQGRTNSLPQLKRVDANKRWESGWSIPSCPYQWWRYQLCLPQLDQSRELWRIQQGGFMRRDNFSTKKL